jgi:DNA polymerase elongation subunit (family B)
MVTTIKELRCIHRHTIETHPSCFAQGKVKYDFKNDAEFERVLGVPWYKHPDYRIGYLDIEVAHGFNADWGIMLSWAIKEKEGDTVYDVITKDELFNYEFDRRITESLINEINKYKILIGYYSTRFDISYIRTKALEHNFDFPGYILQEKYNGNFKVAPSVYHWDLYYTVKYKLKLSRSSLANTCEFLGIEGKTPIPKKAWKKAAYGDKESLDLVIEHNIADVEITELLHDKLEPFKKWTRRGL